MIYNFFSSLYFENPIFLWSLLGILPLLYIYIKNKYKNRVIVPTIAHFPKAKSNKNYLQHVPILFRILAIAFIITILAKPYKKKLQIYKLNNGINITLCIDVSGSMLAKDFTPNRLEACKNMVSEFLKKRPYDNIAIVLFSGQPFTASSLTPNNKQLLNTVASIDGTMLTPGTALGEGLALAIAQTYNAEGNSIVILFTDGKEEGVHRISAIDAANIAFNQKIKVYTIGIGSEQIASVPVMDRYGNVTDVQEKVSFDEPTLQKIALITKGNYYKATSNNSLTTIYKEIDNIEKTTAKINTEVEKQFVYIPFVITAAIFLLLEFLVSYFYLKR